MGMETTGSVKEIRDIFVEVSQFVANFFGKDYQKFATKYNFALSDYLEAKRISLSKVKMAFFSSQVVELDEIYVPQFISLGNKLCSQESFFESLLQHKKIVVSATAGSGKSCLLKSMFISIIKDKNSLLPLFLELRKVNETNNSIFETLRIDIAIYDKKFNKDNLNYLLDREGTIVFLDGFDEVNHDLKDKFTKEINELADKYPNLIILVSSRPEYNLFSDWSLYNVARIQPLILSQAIEVIKKIDYDEDVKERFTLALENTLFDKQEGFSSNPLLLTIMLVTYEQFGSIPDRVYIFYDHAYQALFNKHDVSKQGFLRKSSTNLDMYELRDIFALFSLFTYSKQMFEMTENEIHTFLKKCLVHSKSEVIDKDLKLELLNNVPLLMRDGLNYCFTHRSFQEYLTAYYIVNHAVKEQVFERACGRYYSDNVVDMAFSMNKDIMEDKWILPKINKILELKPVDITTINRKITLISVFFNRIEEVKDRGKKEIGFTHNENSNFLYYLMKKYDCHSQIIYLNNKYHSYDFTYEETDFFELVLNDKGAIMLEELNDFEKDLVCRMGSSRYGEWSFELIEYIKSLILTNRNDSLDDIENFIFD
ncbi:NACHT domain-containing protein [Psychrobacter aquaticus]|uniref:NACHT domain-containing protein n=1 Tax=Psychrobacter aquaticus CMS 56 TaxID=1354303 RepID=U4TDM2_9GAMM|nr:NACHT domain-containing protein [Psychrobacter aquaticus]ERL56543.1 hypothetical protein M917_0569 [Psychrobacter aquaticus CMS 56]